MIVGVRCRLSSPDLRGVINDMDRTERQVVPNLLRRATKHGEKELSKGRQRFIEYAGGDEAYRSRYEYSAEHFEADYGVLKTGTGAYASVGQTLPRTRRPNPRYSQAMFEHGLGQVLGEDQSMIENDLALAVFEVLTKHRL